MIDAVEYRSVIKFLVLRHVPNDQIFSQLEETYGEDSPSRRAMYKWIALFKHGRQSVFDDQRLDAHVKFLTKLKKSVNLYCEKTVESQRGHWLML